MILLILFIIIFPLYSLLHENLEVNVMSSTKKSENKSSVPVSDKNVMKNAVTPKPEHPGEDPYGCDRPHAMENSTCSATDFTGLIPAGMPDDEELEAYAEMYHYPGDIKNVK
jgi:hypothetical protein